MPSETDTTSTIMEIHMAPSISTKKLVFGAEYDQNGYLPVHVMGGPTVSYKVILLFDNMVWN